MESRITLPLVAFLALPLCLSGCATAPCCHDVVVIDPPDVIILPPPPPDVIVVPSPAPDVIIVVEDDRREGSRPGRQKQVAMHSSKSSGSGRHQVQKSRGSKIQSKAKGGRRKDSRSSRGSGRGRR